MVIITITIDIYNIIKENRFCESSDTSFDPTFRSFASLAVFNFRERPPFENSILLFWRANILCVCMLVYISGERNRARDERKNRE